MTPQQQAELTGGGDCFAHYHSEDRRPTQALLQGLHGIAERRTFNGNVTLTGKEDFVLVDATSPVTITLPIARNGAEIEIGKRAGVGVVTVLPQNLDTILLGTGINFTGVGTSIRFKAFGTDWRPI